MKLLLLAVGERMPRWVDSAFDEYAKRMPPECKLVLRPVAAARRHKRGLSEQIRQDEAQRLTAARPKGAMSVALEVTGQPWSSEQLAAQLQQWLQGGRDVALMIGGPDGLAPALSQSADLRWSLSPLTLPHPLVRIVVAEQLYRAWSMLCGHPYHK